MPSDEELMARYVAGDQTAFCLLFGRYAPRLTGMMRRSIANADDVADLVQQTFFQVHRARKDFRQGAKLRPWLFSIAINLKRRYFRDKARRRIGSLESDPEGTGEGATAGAERKEDVAGLLRALQTLPDNQREVIELHWFEGLPFAEIGRRLGASLSAVKVRAHRGYKRLREEMAGG